MRCGASKITVDWRTSARRASAPARSSALLDRKPANAKPSAAVSPATLSAVMALLAPGNGITRWPAAATTRTSTAPGSETAGVPASLR